MELEVPLTVVVSMRHWSLFYTEMLLNDDDIFTILKWFLISVYAS
jgi:hypothetical protein